MSTTEQVLSDFMDAWNAGRRPRVREYLEQVPEGAERDELAEQITTWLEVAPTPAYDDAARAAIRREPAVQHVFSSVGADAGLWPTVVPALRVRAGLSVRELATRVVTAFGLGRGDEERAAEYLTRLERGELPAGRVSRRLLDVLGSALGASAGTLADAAGYGSGLRRPAAAALFRADDAAGTWVADDITALSRAAMTPAPAAMDELDRLFTGGPDA
jgi:transcriptional regulator with XRE-family HTH domain